MGWFFRISWSRHSDLLRSFTIRSWICSPFYRPLLNPGLSHLFTGTTSSSTQLKRSTTHPRILAGGIHPYRGSRTSPLHSFACVSYPAHSSIQSACRPRRRCIGNSCPRFQNNLLRHSPNSFDPSRWRTGTSSWQSHTGPRRRSTTLVEKFSQHPPRRKGPPLSCCDQRSPSKL